MSEELVTIASFQSALAAQIAIGRLGDEGIEAFSGGDLAAAAFAGIGSLGPVQIQVRSADVERAAALLAELEGPPDPDWETEAEGEDDLWVCSLCGEAVALERGACPSCQTPRDAIRTKETSLLTQTRPAQSDEGIERRDRVAAGPSVVLEKDLIEDASELADPATFLEDDLARRAFRAALFGCMTLVFLFNLYSLWLSWRLCMMPGELTPANSSRLRWTFLLNGIILAVYVAAFGSVSLFYFD